MPGQPAPIREPISVSTAPQRSKRGRDLKNRAFVWVCLFAATVSVAILALLLASIVIQGVSRVDAVNGPALRRQVVSARAGRAGFVDVPAAAITRVADESWRVRAPGGREISVDPAALQRDGDVFVHRFPDLSADLVALGVPPEPPLRFVERDIIEKVGVYEIDIESLPFREAWVVRIGAVQEDQPVAIVEASTAQADPAAAGSWRSRTIDGRPIRFQEDEIIERVSGLPTRGSPASEVAGWISKDDRAMRRLEVDHEAMSVSGWSSITRHTQAGDFVTGFASRNPLEAGFKAALWGSIALCLVCAMVAIPLGVATAIALEEFKPRRQWLQRLHAFVNLNVGNLAGIPSIVYGILGLTVFVRMFGLFGSPNLSTFDQMLDIRLTGGETIRATLSRELSHGLVVVDPLVGTRWIPADQIQSRREVFVGEQALFMKDGRTVRGSLRSVGEGTITVAEAGREPVTVAAVDVARLGGRELIEIGSRDSFFYFRLPLGGSVFAGGLTLALVVLPIVIVASREALRAVPSSIREGAFALGCTRWQMVRRGVLPCAVPGIMTGSILSMSRAIGEAAPLLVIGGFLFIMFTPRNMMDDFAAMPLQIFNWAQRPQTDFHEVAAAGILVLLAVLLAFNLAASIIRHKFQKPLQ